MVLKISLSQGLSIAYIFKFGGGRLVFSRWPKVNNARPLDNTDFVFISYMFRASHLSF